MIVNNQIINDEFISEEGLFLQNVRPLLEEKFKIQGFSQVCIHGKKAIIRETAAIKKLCIEDKSIPNSYWLGTKKGGLIPGDIDPDKLIVIANLDLDVPICIDFRSQEINPPIIWLGNNGWEQICNSHEEFIRTLYAFRVEE